MRQVCWSVLVLVLVLVLGSEVRAERTQSVGCLCEAPIPARISQSTQKAQKDVDAEINPFCDLCAFCGSLLLALLPSERTSDTQY